MRIPSKLALMASVGVLVLTGLTVGSGYAFASVGSNDDPIQVANQSLQQLPPPESKEAQFRHRGKRGHVVQVVADSLGMERVDVVGLMKDGQTLAQIIEANDGNVEGIVETLIRPLREKLQEKVDNADIDQDQMYQHLAQAKERITKVLNTEHTDGRNGHHSRPGHIVQVVADALGMEPGDVVGLMKQGQTLAQIIEANDGNVEEIVDTLMAQAEESITKVLNGERPEGIHQSRGGDGSPDNQFRGRNRRAMRGSSINAQ